MPWRTPAIWAAATAATLAAAAGAVYWAHPAFLWSPPASSPVAIAGQRPAPTPAAAAHPNPVQATGRASSAPAAPDRGPAESAARPAFDVVNVAPTGDTVVAGRAAPNAKVELHDAGRTVAEATANPEGQFVIIPPALAPGPHTLTLAQAGTGPAPQTSNPIDVAVPAPEPKASEAPPAPAPKTSTAATSAAPPPAPGPAVAVAVQSVEASGGGLVAKGAAPPDATVRLYLSDAYVGDAKTGSDGRWSLTIKHGLTPGAYSVRADEINPKNAMVVARAEAAFDYVESAAKPAPSDAAKPEAALATPSSADLVIDSIRTHHVEAGHTLWGISQKFYGDGSRYEIIFAANSNQIKNPNLIYPGQVLVVPKPGPKP